MSEIERYPVPMIAKHLAAVLDVAKDPRVARKIAAAMGIKVEPRRGRLPSLAKVRRDNPDKRVTVTYRTDGSRSFTVEETRTEIADETKADGELMGIEPSPRALFKTRTHPKIKVVL